MESLAIYLQNALKHAEITPLGGGEGYAARIPGFKGLIVSGETKAKAKQELKSALEGWVELALRRGQGLPSLEMEPRELVTAH
jgi:predicted RNase H-like HicB family nuclease